MQQVAATYAGLHLILMGPSIDRRVLFDATLKRKRAETETAGAK